MTLIELFAPKGALDDTRRRRLGERIVTELIHAGGAPADVIERARELTWLVIHEPDTWTVAGRPVEPDAPPRYIVRMTVPGGHMDEAMRAEAVARITRALAETEDDPERLLREPDARVYLIDVLDGYIGAFGRPVSTDDIIRMVVEPGHRAVLAGGAADHDASPDSRSLIDPICGMTVDLNDSALTLVHEGTTYAFCNPSCRDIFMARLEKGVQDGSTDDA